MRRIRVRAPCAVSRVRTKRCEVALAHRCRWNYRVVHAVVHVLLVVLGSEEKEDFIAAVVEVRAWDDQRTANIPAGIKVFGFGARKARVLILRIVSVQMPTAGIGVGLAMELLSPRLANGTNHDRPLGFVRPE